MASHDAAKLDNSKQEFRIEGDLTWHGVTKPITLTAKLNKAAPNPFNKLPTLGFSATGSLQRSDFGMASAIPLIGDTVTITLGGIQTGALSRPSRKDSSTSIIGGQIVEVCAEGSTAVRHGRLDDGKECHGQLGSI